MPATIDIAEAVKTELNAGSFSRDFEAERLYAPKFELPDMKTLHVSVVPHGIESEAGTRTTHRTDVQVDIAIQQKLSKTDAAMAGEIDELMALVEQIADYLRQRQLTDFPHALWIRDQNVPVYSQEHLEQFRQFTSVLTLTYRAFR